MAVEIEDATLEHLDKLFEIELQCFTNEAFTKRQISYLLTDYNTIGLVAKIKNDNNKKATSHIAVMSMVVLFRGILTFGMLN